MAVTDLLSSSLTLVYVHLWGLLSQAQADDCLSAVGWGRPHTFDYTSINNDCIGSRYTTTYKVKNTTFHVAAVLCTPNRYKLLIKDASDPKGKYRDIGDSYGNGEDHCELVGTDMEYRSDIKLGSPSKGHSKQGIGYYRDGWGKPFKRGRIDFSDSPQWYECGISIPSSKKIYACKDREEERVDYARAAGLAVAVVIGGIVGTLIGFACLIYLTLRCIIDGVPYIESKLCAWREEEPPMHVPPDVLRSARPLRSAMTHGPAPLPHIGAPSPLTPPPASPTAASPSAPPRAPPWGTSAASAQSYRTREEGAPPTYEEAENYPLVTTVEAAPPPYKDHASYKVHYTSF